jgi:hypothetical protein
MAKSPYSAFSNALIYATVPAKSGATLTDWRGNLITPTETLVIECLLQFDDKTRLSNPKSIKLPSGSKASLEILIGTAVEPTILDPRIKNADKVRVEISNSGNIGGVKKVRNIKGVLPPVIYANAIIKVNTLSPFGVDVISGQSFSLELIKDG